MGVAGTNPKKTWHWLCALEAGGAGRGGRRWVEATSLLLEGCRKEALVCSSRTFSNIFVSSDRDVTNIAPEFVDPLRKFQAE